MWGLIYSNRKCNEYERFMQHKYHLQRIADIKPAIKLKEPKKPGFLFRNNKKEKEDKSNLIRLKFSHKFKSSIRKPTNNKKDNRITNS
jgi:hypothetical protein